MIQYKLVKFSFWPIAVSLIILVALLLLYPFISFLQAVKKDYLIGWSDELQEMSQKAGTTKFDPSLSASNFWTLYSLVVGKEHKYLIEKSTRTMSFYAEVLNLMGNVMAWVLYLNSQEGKKFKPQSQYSLNSYIFVVVVSFITATASFYTVLGFINFVRLRILQKHYAKIEKSDQGFTKRLVYAEFIYMTICFIAIVTWLGLFAALSTLLLNSEVSYWLYCCLGASILSYVIIDSVLVVIFKILKSRKMLILLVLRSMSSEYLTLSVVSALQKNLETSTSTKGIEVTGQDKIIFTTQS